MGGGIADENASHFEGRMQPFVRVECDESACSKPRTRWAFVGRDGEQRADAAVDVEPEVFSLPPDRQALEDHRSRRC